MSQPAPPIGTIAWCDLTVPHAETVRDFYADVAGWKPRPVPMGEYSDFEMLAPSGDTTAGICHARGSNANLPPVWLVYILVKDLDASLAAVARMGGAIVDGPRQTGQGRFCVIRDPAGAACALFQPA